MINGIHHAAISTPDIERALQFYRDLLGAEVITDYDWPVGRDVADKILGLTNSSARTVLLRLGNAMVELFEFSSPEPQTSVTERAVCDHGITHICLDVTDIQHEYERLKAAGMTFNCPPQDLGPFHSTYGRDPDGNVIELQEVVDANSPVSLHHQDTAQE